VRRLAGALVVAALLVPGCAADPQDPGLVPGPPDVEVDTAQLRAAKAEIGMERCPEATGDGAVEGGLPELTLPCLGGGADVAMESLRGPMVLNLWQSFCAPCREEMPALQAFHERHGDQVPVIGIDYQDTRPQAALELAGETGATYPSIADPGGELNGLGAFPSVRGLPYFVLVDADGTISHVEAGGVTEVAEVEQMVEQHLGVSL
jgi:thiol-disulfide isomerase/thioredoxin